MGFPHLKILKQAWEIVSNHKFLWIFGLFLIGGRAATIISVQDLLEKKEIGLKLGLKKARPYQNRVLATSLLLGLVVTIVVAIMILPILYLLAADLVDRATALATLALVIFLPFLIVITLLNIFSAHFICLYDLGIRSSLGASWNLIGKKWPVIMLFFSLLWFTLSIAFIALVFMVFLGLKVFTGSLPWLLLILFFLPVIALVSSFHLTSWVLAFRELVKPAKTDQAEEVVAAPEVI